MRSGWKRGLIWAGSQHPGAAARLHDRRQADMVQRGLTRTERLDPNSAILDRETMMPVAIPKRLGSGRDIFFGQLSIADYLARHWKEQ